jgi:hypothetical protein
VSLLRELFFLNEPRYIVVMDNATIHMDERVRLLVESRGAFLIYQSAYSLDLDPIEFCFRQYKADLKRHNMLLGRRPYEAHWHALQSVSRANMMAYYRKMVFIKNVTEEESRRRRSIKQLSLLP